MSNIKPPGNGEYPLLTNQILLLYVKLDLPEQLQMLVCLPLLQHIAKYRAFNYFFLFIPRFAHCWLRYRLLPS